MTMFAYSEVPLYATQEDLGALGRYALRRELGANASGTVWTAFDPETDQEVAVTLMRTRFGRADERANVLEVAKRWLDFAGPNVARVLEVGLFVDPRDPDHPRTGVYVVRDRVAGTDLQHWLDTLPANLVPPATAQILDFMVAAGHGLAAIHRAGLVHRDVRPATIVVGYDGTATLVDFATDGALPMRPSENDEAPRYPAPELREGATADARADQYSFCATLHGALSRQPDVRLSRRLREVIARGMAERPEDRWASMDELLAALTKSRSGWFRVLAAALGA
jgi:serine/threonine-protein kinase